jgi:Spy/CpxP family protein refolding chaperone
MKKSFVAFALSLLFVSCASTDYDEPPRTRGRGPSAEASADGLNIVPLTQWWREPAISGALNLTNDQFVALDRIAAERQDDITRLERDNGTALRDLRQTLDSNQPSVADITTAAQRVRALRDTLFDRQTEMLAAERTLLTQQQWQALQQQLRAERTQRDGGNGYPRRGRGGMGGGRGRWPGF